MNNQHPIVPPCKLIEKWHAEYLSGNKWKDVITQAAQWGADQELEACCEWTQGYAECGDSLRLARRSKPLSLKEQALSQLTIIQADLNKFGMGVNTDTIQRALEALPND